MVHRQPSDTFAARWLVDAGSERVTKTFRFVASTFSNVRSFEWEMWVDGNFAYTVAVERYTASADGGPFPRRQSSGQPTCIAARTDIGAPCTATPTAGRPTDPPTERNPVPDDSEVRRGQDLKRRHRRFPRGTPGPRQGDPEPAMSFFSDRDDVTLANPLEPLVEGPPRSRRRPVGRWRTSKRAHCTSRRCPAASRNLQVRHLRGRLYPPDRAARGQGRRPRRYGRHRAAGHPGVPV